MKNLLLAGTAALCLISGPAIAQDKKLDDVNKTAFESVDANNDGLVSMREVEHYRKLVMRANAGLKPVEGLTGTPSLYTVIRTD
ncbi:MAG: hypothetical protein ACR2PA_15210 [Hyphomicrobiaceae bacterium]